MQKRMLAIGSQLSSGEIDRFDLRLNQYITITSFPNTSKNPFIYTLNSNNLRVKARRNLTYSWVIKHQMKGIKT
jgi:hypothetical protein